MVCCVVLCCVVLCSGIVLGEMYLSRGLLRTSQFFLRQDTTLHSNSTVAQQSRGTKNKFSIASIIMQILYLSRVRDGFLGEFYELIATRIRKIYDFPRGKCFLRTGDKNFLAYTV